MNRKGASKKIRGELSLIIFVISLLGNIKVPPTWALTPEEAYHAGQSFAKAKCEAILQGATTQAEANLIAEASIDDEALEVYRQIDLIQQKRGPDNPLVKFYLRGNDNIIKKICPNEYLALPTHNIYKSNTNTIESN